MFEDHPVAERVDILKLACFQPSNNYLKKSQKISKGKNKQCHTNAYVQHLIY